jgi:hypothetical protein
LIRNLLLLLAVATVCVGSAWAAENAAIAPGAPADTALGPEILTNEGVVALATAGFSDAFIMEKIRLSDRTRLDVSVGGLSYLRRNAITERLVLFILKCSAEPVSTSPTPAAPAIVPTVIKAKLKMKKIAVPMEAVNVIFVPNGTGLPANAAMPALPSPMLPTVVMQQPSSSYIKPVPANGGPVALPKTAAPATDVAWWQFGDTED